MVPFRLSRREIRRVFALTALFFFAAYLSRFVSFGFTHDSLQIDQSGGALFQISLGRFMQPLYWLVRGDIVMPYVVGLLSFTFLSASICLCCALLSIRSTLGIACVCMTLCCNATLSLSSATFISWLDVYMLAVCAVPVARLIPELSANGDFAVSDAADSPRAGWRPAAFAGRSRL